MCKRIFIASSIHLHVERNKISGIFLRENNRLESCKYRTFMCEMASDSIANARKQDEYNEIIQKSDYLLALVRNREIGEYTWEEIRTAMDSYDRNKKPRILMILLGDAADTENDLLKIDPLKSPERSGNPVELLVSTDWDEIEKWIWDHIAED